MIKTVAQERIRETFNLTYEHLASIVAVGHAALSEQPDCVLSSVLLRIHNGELAIVATDAKLAARHLYKVDVNADLEFNLNWSKKSANRKSIKTLMSVMRGCEGGVRVEYDSCNPHVLDVASVELELDPTKKYPSISELFERSHGFSECVQHIVALNPNYMIRLVKTFTQLPKYAQMLTFIPNNYKGIIDSYLVRPFNDDFHHMEARLMTVKIDKDYECVHAART